MATRVLRKYSEQANPEQDSVENMQWAVWQLADDVATYGDNAGGFIITTVDGEIEVCGVCLDETLANHIVTLHNKWQKRQ